MTMKAEYTIQRDGKTFALYAGLLDVAHEKGLLSIETALVQIPTPENANVAICTATVRMGDKDGVPRTFTGIGDASPGNVNRMMATALIRMAETRSKARALRDAINLAEALADDPTEDDEPHSGAQTKPQAAANGKPSDNAEQERLAKATTWYQRHVKLAQEHGVEYVPLKQLATLKAIVSEGKALRHKLDGVLPKEPVTP